MDIYGDYSTPVSYILTIPAFTYILVERNYGPIEHSLDTGVVSTPDWDLGNGTIFTNCLVHPVDYTILPQDTQVASYVPPGGTGFELFDNFVNGWPASCTVEFPVIDSLGSGTSIRSSEVVNEYLIGLANQGIVGEDFVIALQPGWDNAVISNGLVHPTCYCVVPTTIHNASYVSVPNLLSGACVGKSFNTGTLMVGSGVILIGGCTLKANLSGVLTVTRAPGFDIFDTFIFDAQPSTAISFVQDVTEPFPWDTTLNADYKPGYSNGAMSATLSISWSSDQITWVTLASGLGSLFASYIARFVRLQVVLDNTQPVGFVKTMGGEVVAGSSKYWTSIFAQIKTSPDNITFGNWIESDSNFISDRYIKPKVTWNPTSGLWPVSVSSLWILLDSSQNNQSGFSVPIASGGTTITFPNPYRSKVSVTVTSVSVSSAYAEVISYTLTSFAVQVFNAGSPIAGAINWHSIGV
jgi:hypothetical protein